MVCLGGSRDFTSTMAEVLGEISGQLVIVGAGSIFAATLPLLERHIRFDPRRLVVVAPEMPWHPEESKRLVAMGSRWIKSELTRDNYREVLAPLLTAPAGPVSTVCLNLSVNCSSVALGQLCSECRALYLDTSLCSWSDDWEEACSSKNPSDRTNWSARQPLLAAKAASRPGAPTAVHCCGANPGMVNWLVKAALVELARGRGILPPGRPPPVSRQDWARLMATLGVRGIHTTERDTQRPFPNASRAADEFVNTWCPEDMYSEGEEQPAELSVGTHEEWLPPGTTIQPDGCAAYLDRPGMRQRIRSWSPSSGPQWAYLVAHEDSVQIGDYYQLRDAKGEVSFRPTVAYAYHPCGECLDSFHTVWPAGGPEDNKLRLLREDEILDGLNEVGVLLYGQPGEAFWMGSQLSIEQARSLAPRQNATGMQVSSAVLAGLVWALENPTAGVLEADELDYQRCLELQTPYLGSVTSRFVEWHPLLDRESALFPDDIDASDPWQLRNMLEH